MTTPETEPLNTEPEAAAEVEQDMPVSICVCGHKEALHLSLKCTVEGCGCDYLTEDTGATIEANAEPASEEAKPDAEPAEVSADAAQGSEAEQPEQAAGKRRRKKAEQMPLPEMGERDIEAIVQAAEKYRELHDERMALSKQEKDAKENLIQVMRNYKRTVYNYRGLRVELSEETSVSVRAKDDAESAAAKRETRRMVADIESVVIERQQQSEPTTEESLANAEAFFSNSAANEEIAEALQEAQEADDFTAERCDECKAIDGAHDSQCSRSESTVLKGVLPFEDYVSYARFKEIKHATTWARKWQLSGKEDGRIKAWKEEGAEKAAERIASAPTTSAKPEPKRNRNRGRNRHANA